MQWVTRDNVHMDRVASPWLIKRFVDPAAEFLFIGWEPGTPRPDGAIPFGMPGVELSSHDAQGSTFGKILRKYRLEDPALVRMQLVIDRGIDIFMHGAKPAPDDEAGQIAVGLLATSEGMMLVSASDAEILAASAPLYDALHATFTVHARMQAQGLALPKPTRPGPGEKNAFLRQVYRGTV